MSTSPKNAVQPLYFGEVRKSINMPPALWQQISERLNSYNPPLAFVDWARRVFQSELRNPPRVLADYSARPKE
jgi:hypothetical protein